MNALAFDELSKPENLRFVPDFNGLRFGGNWLARKPVRYSEEELLAFCGNSSWRIARKELLAVAHMPFDAHSYKEEKFFPFPWGRQRSPFSARRIFVERGVSVAGLYNGPASGNLWWFAYDGQRRQLCRYYSAGNTGVYDAFLKEGKMEIPDSLHASAILGAIGMPVEAQDDYLRAFSGELEDNEGFALQRPASREEAGFLAPVLEEMGQKLAADSGILWVSPLSDNRMYFGAGGGCSGCSRLRINTYRVFTQAVKQCHPGVEVCLYPELEDWDSARLYESYEDLAQQMAGSHPLLAII